MIRRYSFAAVLATSLMLAPTVAAAQVTTFTSFAGWQAAQVGAQLGVDTFEDRPFGFTAAPLTRSAGAFNYAASVFDGTGSPEFYTAGTLSDRWLSTGLANASIVFGGFSAGVNAIGGAFFGSNIIGAFRSADIQLAWVTSAGSGSITLTAPTTSSFFGLITTGTLTSFTVSAVQPADGTFRWTTVNDLRLGGATVVPEPSTFALVVTGLMALAVRRRRQHA